MFLIFIIYFLCLRYKKYRKKNEIEKKLLGKKNNLNQFMDFTEEDFKIKLNNIKNLEEIGYGTSAFVFKGKLNNEYVALKIFKVSLFDKDSENFKKELKMISKFKNSNIVNFIGFIAEDSQFGIVLEFCEFGSLKSFLNKSKKISFMLKMKILIDISKGMEYIHFKNLIFRDLKLDNVLITKEINAKISDFGISRFANENSNTKTMNVGTNLYMVNFY